MERVLDLESDDRVMLFLLGEGEGRTSKSGGERCCKRVENLNEERDNCRDYEIELNVAIRTWEEVRILLDWWFVRRKEMEQEPVEAFSRPCL